MKSLIHREKSSSGFWSGCRDTLLCLSSAGLLFLIFRETRELRIQLSSSLQRQQQVLDRLNETSGRILSTIEKLVERVQSMPAQEVKPAAPLAADAAKPAISSRRKGSSNKAGTAPRRTKRTSEGHNSKPTAADGEAAQKQPQNGAGE
jgi:hypothetical protein